MLRDGDYLFGASGDVMLRFEKTHELRTFQGAVWVFLRGTEVHATGGRSRDLLVRRDALRDRRRFR
jgi:hypothetical protein